MSRYEIEDHGNSIEVVLIGSRGTRYHSTRYNNDRAGQRMARERGERAIGRPLRRP